MKITVNYQFTSAEELSNFLSMFNSVSNKNSNFFKKLVAALPLSLPKEELAKLRIEDIKTLLKYGQLAEPLATNCLNIVFDNVSYTTSAFRQHLNYLKMYNQDYNQFFSSRQKQLKYSSYISIYLAFQNLFLNEINLNYFPEIKKHQEFIWGVESKSLVEVSLEQNNLFFNDLINYNYSNYYSNDHCEINENRFNKIAFNYFIILKKTTEQNPHNLKIDPEKLLHYINKIFSYERNQSSNIFGAPVKELTPEQYQEYFEKKVLYQHGKKGLTVTQIIKSFAAFEVDTIKETLHLLDHQVLSKHLPPNFINFMKTYPQKLLIEACILNQSPLQANNKLKI